MDDCVRLVTLWGSIISDKKIRCTLYLSGIGCKHGGLHKLSHFPFLRLQFVNCRQSDALLNIAISSNYAGH